MLLGYQLDLSQEGDPILASGANGKLLTFSQQFDAPEQSLVTRQNHVPSLYSDCTYQHVDGPALHPMTAAKIKQSSRLDVISGANRLIGKWLEQPGGIHELRFVLDTGQDFLTDRADYHNVSILDCFREPRDQSLLFRVQATLVSAPQS
jgi:hypothetical protein